MGNPTFISKVSCQHQTVTAPGLLLQVETERRQGEYRSTGSWTRISVTRLTEQEPPGELAHWLFIRGFLKWVVVAVQKVA